MNQITAIKNTFGEVIHDHQGSYVTISSGEMKDAEISQFILKDTEIGESDDVNQILDLGLSNGCKYVWSNYCSKHCAASVAMGRSHAVYTKCTLDTVKDAGVLLFYPYAGMEESRSMLKNQEEFQNTDRKEFFLELALENLKEEMKKGVKVSKELLYHMICYSLKQKATGFRNFLYIVVPDTVEDYQSYCKNIMVQFLQAIPVGLRKQLRFATNAAAGKENNYHILFCRESVLKDSEKWQKAVRVEENEEIPQFLKEHGLDANLAAFLRKCADSACDASKENVVEACFENMETKIGDISQLKERDYRDYYEISKLGKQSLTVDVLKGYSDKLGQPLAEKQRQMLHAQIHAAVLENEVLEETLKLDPEVIKASEMSDLLNALAPYKAVIQHAKGQEVALSKTFYEGRMKCIQDTFWEEKCPNKENAKTQTVLELEKEWEKILKEKKSSLTVYFTPEYIEESISDSIAEQEKLEEQYKKEQIAAWKKEVLKPFSVENLREICQKMQDSYPDEVADFCKYICDILVSALKEKPQMVSLVKASVDTLRGYDPKVSVPEELYEAYVTKTMKNLLENPIQKRIETETNKIEEIYGEENRRAFTASLSENLTQLFYHMIEKENVFNQQAYEEISDLMACIKMLAGERQMEDGVEKAFAYWCDEKKRQERRKKIQEQTRSFESYFYSCTNEADLIKELDKDALRKQIYERNISKKKKKIMAGYTVGAFLAAASYAKECPMEEVLSDEFYLAEFERFMLVGKMPILIRKQDTIPQIYHQVKCYHKLCGGFNEDVTFICYENGNKTEKMSVSCQVVMRVLDTLIKVRNQIPVEVEETERKNLSISEKDFWEYLYKCGVLTAGDCEKLAVFGEKSGIRDLEELGDKFIGKKKSKKLVSRIVKGGILILVLALFVGTFLAGRVSAQTNEASIENQRNQTEVSEEVEKEESDPAIEKKFPKRDMIIKDVLKNEK